MAFTPAPGEQFTIRRKVLKLFGAAFHIYDAANNVVGFCKQKAFRLREDIRVYADESQSKELLRIGTQSIMDISGTYDIRDPEGRVVGSLKRGGMSSIFLRDKWEVFGPEQKPLGTLMEDSGLLGVLRRYVDLVSLISPQKFVLLGNDGREIARFRQHFNWFVYRLGISIHDFGKPNAPDTLLVVGAACIVAAIEGRQN